MEATRVLQHDAVGLAEKRTIILSSRASSISDTHAGGVSSQTNAICRIGRGRTRSNVLRINLRINIDKFCANLEFASRFRPSFAVKDRFAPRAADADLIQEAIQIRRGFSAIAAAGAALLLTALGSAGAFAQKSGGVLKMPDFASPASMSIHEEATRAAVTPLMGVFNNLVLFDQHVPQNSLASLVDLALSWSWDETQTTLTFRLRSGVRWHDGEPFTSRDVKCTWDTLAGKSSDKFRLNPRKSWYRNLEEVTTNGDEEVTFHLKRPQPYFLTLLASGVSPVYPCHVTPAQMRQHPIGTGPFKFVEFKPNESIKVTKNPHYWKPGRPYLDGMEFPIIPSVATRALVFVVGTVDMTLSYGVSMPLLRDLRSQVPDAICEVDTDNGSGNLIINRAVPPFDKPELRRAMTLTLDRKAFIDILVEGQGLVGGAMQPPPDGVWGMPPELLKTLPGYGFDIADNRVEARKIMDQPSASRSLCRPAIPPGIATRPSSQPTS